MFIFISFFLNTWESFHSVSSVLILPFFVCNFFQSDNCWVKKHPIFKNRSQTFLSGGEGERCCFESTSLAISVTWNVLLALYSSHVFGRKNFNYFGSPVVWSFPLLPTYLSLSLPVYLAGWLADLLTEYHLSSCLSVCLPVSHDWRIEFKFFV